MRFHTALLLLFSLSLPLAAAERWTVDDVLLAERASSVEVSRDGKMAVWVLTKMDKKKGTSAANLVLRNLAEDYEVTLTRGTDRASAPAFSPDGHNIAFLSTRKKPDDGTGDEKPSSDSKTQVWLISTRGGEPYKLTSFKNGVKEVNWLDNDTLLLTATEDPTLYHQQIKESKDTSNIVDDDAHAAPVRLFRFELKGKKATRLTENTDRIDDTYVSDDGVWVLTTHQRSLAYEYNQKVRPVTFLHDLENGTQKQLFTDGKLLPKNVQFTTDAKGYYFSAAFASHPVYLMAGTPYLYYYDIESAQATRVEQDWERGFGSALTVTPDGVVALMADGARFKPALYKKAGDSWTRSWIEGEHARNIFGIELSSDGKTLVYEYSTASKPSQWFAAKLVGATVVDAKQITKLNPHLDNKTMARTEIVTWTGALDEEVEGVIYYPTNYEKGKKYPLVLMIHGGPHGADMDRFGDRVSYPHNLFAQEGAFILKPNYHGSGNYGLKWGESITGGKYNDLEWIDCERGVDMMIEKGLADPERLGVMGWSNGSIIAIEITTRTTRYKVASAGAGDVNWLSDWGNCQFGHSFDDLYLGTTPLADPDFYLKKSPLFRMDKVETPTIIFFGTIDRQVPTEQGWQHYRALQHLGKTDVRFILFPGEAHSPRKYVHQRRKIEDELAWFDKYLFKTGKPVNESLKPASPLSAALKLKAAGETPETVERGEISIGRFEVTRAQYKAFRATYQIPAGTEAYPASGISFEDAKAYCEWLSKKTGQTYRLGTEEEMGKYLKASAKENTLDAWAGYAVNTDDAAKLAKSIQDLGPGALLRPAGSFPGSGTGPAFDLGGNAAEWVVDEKGNGKALGGSADRPADPKSTSAPAPDYTGFRVVKE